MQIPMREIHYVLYRTSTGKRGTILTACSMTFNKPAQPPDDDASGHPTMPADERGRRSQPGDKYHVFIQGANHMSFISAKTRLPARAARGESILGYTNSAALAFWDAYLKADPTARDYLQSDALSNSTQGTVKASRR